MASNMDGPEVFGDNIFVREDVEGIVVEGVPVAKKLHGRAFYESIGSPKFILAPMVDQSEFVCIPMLNVYGDVLIGEYNRHGVS